MWSGISSCMPCCGYASRTGAEPGVQARDAGWRRRPYGYDGDADFISDSEPVLKAQRALARYAQEMNHACAGDWAINSLGLRQREFPVLFRGDRRDPAALIRNRGFGPSSHFVCERRLTADFAPLIASASLAGATCSATRATRQGAYWYVYALDTRQLAAVSLRENALNEQAAALEALFGEPLRDERGELCTYGFYGGAWDCDHVHVDAAIDLSRIYLVDTNDPAWEQPLASYFSDPSHAMPGYALIALRGAAPECGAGTAGARPPASPAAHGSA
jgi:hypothetical protein